jgi:putative phosphoesterase
VIVGILSDTHGRADAATAAVRVLVERGAEQLIHCGDVGDGAEGRAVLDAMAGHNAAFVFGNNDYDERELARYAGDLGIFCLSRGGAFDFDGKRAEVTHGDDLKYVRRILAAQKVDYLFVGHTHVPLDRLDGRVRTINPGAQYRATTKTVALLDTVADTVEFLTVTVPA